MAGAAAQDVARVMARHVHVLTAPMKRSDFASDAAYQRYLEGLAAMVDMVFTQRSHAESARESEAVPVDNPSHGEAS